MSAMFPEFPTSWRPDADHRTFSQIARHRLLSQLSRSFEGDKVMIVDNFTTKILSNLCIFKDLIDLKFCLVDFISNQRESCLHYDVVYFMQPTQKNIDIFLSDMSGRRMYMKAQILFTRSIQVDMLDQLKASLPKDVEISTLHLEYIPIDSQGFLTGNDKALEELLTGSEDDAVKYNECINTMATRIATVFFSMKELPRVHYRVPRTVDPNVVTTLWDLVPSKLAAAVWDNMERYKSIRPEFPQIETCELLIVDRSVDPIVPFIHGWTYEAIYHDVLSPNEIEVLRQDYSASESVLLDNDPVWLELRHEHISDVFSRLGADLAHFGSTNQAARLQAIEQTRATHELSAAANYHPVYVHRFGKLLTHKKIAEKIRDIIIQQHLIDVGDLEQDLVFGGVGAKKVIDFFGTFPDISRENKLRLVMVYAAINPEEMHSDKGEKLMQLAGLSADDLIAVKNMCCLWANDTKKSAGGFAKIFNYWRKPGIRKEREFDESNWSSSRFYPVLEELIEKLSKDELPKNEYHCMNGRLTKVPYHPTCAEPEETGADSSSERSYLGKRLFIFVVGGATWSELRSAHILSRKLKREVILGSSSINDPRKFISKLKDLRIEEELTLDDVVI